MAAPSLFCEEIVTLYNNTIYPVVAEVIFGVIAFGGKGSGSSHSLAPGKGTRIKFATRSSGQSIPISAVKATVPAQQEPIWEGGKIIGQKIMRQKKSVVLNTSHKHLTSSVFFVINANRQPSFINGFDEVKNLAIYRFIQ